MTSIEENLCKLISFRTDGNKDEIAKLVSYMVDILEMNDLVYEVIKNDDGKENIVALIGGSDFKNLKDAILLSGHLDVVRGEDKLFNPIFDKGYVVGRGAVDMKSFIAIVLSSIKELKEIGKPIVLAITSDEETKVLGVKKILEFFRENSINFKSGIVGEPTNLAVGIANKGYVSGKICVKGKAVHSSINKQGVNVVEIINKLWSKIFELNDKYYDKGCRLNIGKIKCDNDVNVVADKGSFEFEIRYEESIQKDEIINVILYEIERLKIDYKNSKIECNWDIEIPVFEENKESILAKKMLNNKNMKSKKLDYVTEAGFYQSYGIDVVVFGAGVDELCHTDDEKILVNDCLDYKNKLLEILV